MTFWLVPNRLIKYSYLSVYAAVEFVAIRRLYQSCALAVADTSDYRDIISIIRPIYQSHWRITYASMQKPYTQAGSQIDAS